MREGIVALTAVLLVCVVPRAQADPVTPSTVIFSTFGPNDTYGDSAIVIDSGVFAVSAVGSEEAVGFTPAAPFTLDSIRVPIGLLIPSMGGNPALGGNELNLSLTTFIGGRPGPPIESFQLTVPDTTGAVVTATSLVHPLLNPGTEYWVLAAVPDTPPAIGSSVRWHFPPNIASLGDVALLQATGIWVLTPAAQPAVEVVGSPAPTPEPASLLLLSTGALGVLCRRFHHI